LGDGMDRQGKSVATTRARFDRSESQQPLVDLDAYCFRIGYDGPRTPTLATLRALHERHVATIPFENMDVLMGRGVDIAPATVDEKLITAGRGGYCYEQNGLFKRVLATIGFKVEGLLARVRWMKPATAPLGARTHMALRVTIDDQDWLTDVGFGAVVLPQPVRMDSSEPQPTRHEPFRLTPVGRELLLKINLGESWTPVYQLSPEPQLDADYVPMNWYTSTHPDSHFRSTLMVALTTPEARYTLAGSRMTIRPVHGEMKRQALDADGLARVLVETFGLPVETDWQPVIETAVAVGG